MKNKYLIRRIYIKVLNRLIFYINLFIPKNYNCNMRNKSYTLIKDIVVSNNVIQEKFKTHSHHYLKFKLFKV